MQFWRRVKRKGRRGFRAGGRGKPGMGKKKDKRKKIKVGGI
jgi:hypothetical protein